MTILVNAYVPFSTPARPLTVITRPVRRSPMARWTFAEGRDPGTAVAPAGHALARDGVADSASAPAGVVDARSRGALTPMRTYPICAGDPVVDPSGEGSPAVRDGWSGPPGEGVDAPRAGRGRPPSPGRGASVLPTAAPARRETRRVHSCLTPKDGAVSRLVSLPLAPGIARCLGCGWFSAEPGFAVWAREHTRATAHPTVYPSTDEPGLPG
jgi:hypothetical protein